jgi:hypothetical protein
MAMAWEQWAEIVARLNASWPDQQIEPPTAREWFDELHHLDAGDVWLAIRELRTEIKWRPSLAEILAGVKVYRAKLAEQAHHQQLERARSRRGTPMPPETKQAMEILADSISGKVDKMEARQMIDALAAQLEARLEREQLMQLETG